MALAAALALAVASSAARSAAATLSAAALASAAAIACSLAAALSAAASAFALASASALTLASAPALASAAASSAAFASAAARALSISDMSNICRSDMSTSPDASFSCSMAAAALDGVSPFGGSAPDGAPRLMDEDERDSESRPEPRPLLFLLLRGEAASVAEPGAEPTSEEALRLNGEGSSERRGVERLGRRRARQAAVGGRDGGRVGWLWLQRVGSEHGWHGVHDARLEHGDVEEDGAAVRAALRQLGHVDQRGTGSALPPF